MNFQAKDLDACYEVLKNLFLLSKNEGDKVESGLKSIITNLQQHWKGNDATIHINNLMDVCKKMNDILNSVKSVSHNVSIPIVKAQTIRNSNGGSGDVGELIPLAEEAPLVFNTLDSTAEYFVDPIGAPADYDELCEVTDTFAIFCNKFNEYKDALFDNWVSGSDRERAVNDFEEFETNVTTYTSKLNNAKNNLETAITNLKDI